MQSAAYQFPGPATERRGYTRYRIRARARIRIGNRQYAASLVDISRGGAKISTLTSIQDEGDIVLRLPDLPPIRGHLRWSTATEGGVVFYLPLLSDKFAEWMQTRQRSSESF